MVQRFVILSSPRSGTHMLRTALNGHSNIVCRAESFNPDLIADEPYDTSWTTAEILSRHVFREFPEKIIAAGFAIHRSGAPLTPWTDVWSLLQRDLQLRVIVLHRHDLLRRLLSYIVMCERSKNPRLEPAARRIEAAVLREEFLRYESELAQFKKMFAGHATLQVSYEELCRDFTLVTLRIQRFLGVPIGRIVPKTLRNTTVRAESLVENLSELAAEFRGSRWAWFFEEWSRSVVTRVRAS